MKDVESHNTKDAFGNQLNVGDEVYYFKRYGKTVRFGMGVVTHFTPKWKIAVREKDNNIGPDTILEHLSVAKMFTAKEN